MKKYAHICNKRETLFPDATININQHMDKGEQGQTHQNTIMYIVVSLRHRYKVYTVYENMFHSQRFGTRNTFRWLSALKKEGKSYTECNLLVNAASHVDCQAELRDMLIRRICFTVKGSAQGIHSGGSSP